MSLRIQRFGPACQFLEDGTPEAYMFPRPDGEYVPFDGYERLRKALEEIATHPDIACDHGLIALRALGRDI